MFDDINDLYQQVILDHCKKPRNFHEMPQATCSAQGHNPLCGDNLKLFLTLDGDVITDAASSAPAVAFPKPRRRCSRKLSKAKPRPRRKRRSSACAKWSRPATWTGDVGKLAVFAGVYKYPARVKCAILSWHALMARSKAEAKPVSTESEQT